MRRSSSLLSLVALLGTSETVTAEEVVSPIYKSWARYKVGTVVTFREVIEWKDRKVETTRTQKLVALTDFKAVIQDEQVGNLNGKVETLASVTLEYKKMFPLMPGMTKEDGDKPRGVGEHGEETIKVAGKEYKANWYEAKSLTDHGPAIARTWVSTEVPGKVLRSITKVPSTNKTVTVELIEIKTP
jgi:hypothetical protein